MTPGVYLELHCTGWTCCYFNETLFGTALCQAPSGKEAYPSASMSLCYSECQLVITEVVVTDAGKLLRFAGLVSYFQIRDKISNQEVMIGTNVSQSWQMLAIVGRLQLTCSSLN